MLLQPGTNFITHNFDIEGQVEHISPQLGHRELGRTYLSSTQYESSDEWGFSRGAALTTNQTKVVKFVTEELKD